MPLRSGRTINRAKRPTALNYLPAGQGRGARCCRREAGGLGSPQPLLPPVAGRTRRVDSERAHVGGWHDEHTSWNRDVAANLTCIFTLRTMYTYNTWTKKKRFRFYVLLLYACFKLSGKSCCNTVLVWTRQHRPGPERATLSLRYSTANNLQHRCQSKAFRATKGVSKAV